jgi:hypothetical protein
MDALGRMTVDAVSADGSRVAAGAGDGSGYAVYEVRYRRPNFDIEKDADITSELGRYCVRTGRSCVENLVIPGQSFQWGDENDVGSPAGTGIPADIAESPIAGDSIVPIAGGDFCIEWLQVPEVNWSKIKAALAAPINSAAFDVEFGNWPAETLFLRSVEYTPAQHASSYFYWTHKFTWLYKPQGWNKLYSRSEQDFFKVVDRSTGLRGIFTSSDHHELFKFT